MCRRRTVLFTLTPPLSIAGSQRFYNHGKHPNVKMESPWNWRQKCNFTEKIIFNQQHKLNYRNITEKHIF